MEKAAMPVRVAHRAASWLGWGAAVLYLTGAVYFLTQAFTPQTSQPGDMQLGAIGGTVLAAVMLLLASLCSALVLGGRRHLRVGNQVAAAALTLSAIALGVLPGWRLLLGPHQ